MNKVILRGNNTKDIEIKKTNNGKSVCEFTIAINERKADGSESTEFIDCRAWDKTADNLALYLRKGNSILIEGKIHNEVYEKNDGTKVKKTLVIVYTYEFLTPKENTQNVRPQEQKQEPVEEDTQFLSKPLKIDEDELPFY